jgi:hypothetical protein
MYLILHIFLGGIFVMWTMKKMGYELLPSLTGAIIFTFSSFLSLHFMHLTMIQSVVWLPLIFYYFQRSLKDKSRRDSVIAGLIWGISASGGHPQFQYYFILFFAFVTLFFSFYGRGFREILNLWSLYLTSLIIFAGLWMWQLIPTFTYIGVAERQKLSFEASAENSVPPLFLLVKLILPKIKGFVTGLRKDIGTYWGGPQWSYWEQGIYAGVLSIILIFSPLYVKTSKKEKTFILFLFLVILFSLIFSTGKYGFLYWIFYNIFPLFKKFRNPPRFSIFFLLSASLLSGIAIQNLIKGKLKPANFRKLLIFLFSLTFLSLLSFLIYRGRTAQNEMEYIKLTTISESLRNLSLILAMGSLIFLLFYKFKKVAFLWGLPLFIFWDLYVTYHNFAWGDINPEYFYNPRLIPSYIEKDTDIFRINIRKGSRILLPRNSGAVYFREIIDGYNPMKTGRYINFYSEVPDPTRIDLLNVKYKVSNYKRSLELNENFLGRAFFVEKVQVLDSLEIFNLLKSGKFPYKKIALLEEGVEEGEDLEVGKVSITKNLPEKMEILTENSGRGFLVLSIIHYPKWEAYIDGKKTKLYRTDYTLLGLFVPPGKHRIEIVYNGRDFYLGLIISMIFLVASAIFLIRKK